MTDRHFGFKLPYPVRDFLEHRWKNVYKSPLLTGQEKEKSGPWANFQMRFSSLTISIKVSFFLFFFLFLMFIFEKERERETGRGEAEREGQL